MHGPMSALGHTWGCVCLGVCTWIWVSLYRDVRKVQLCIKAYVLTRKKKNGKYVK